MCGIVGYVGHRCAEEVLLAGLKRLEYRGYDSAGLATINDGRFHLTRACGRMAALDAKLNDAHCPGKIGLGHTRWATHGEPLEKNAHPHLDQHDRVAIVHNGIIDNYRELREELLKSGTIFTSDTDSEVLAHMISKSLAGGKELVDAVRDTLSKVCGTYALGVMHVDNPSKMVCARKGSPLIIGLVMSTSIDDNEIMFASDINAMINIADHAIYLNDGDICEVFSDRTRIIDMNGNPINRAISPIRIGQHDIDLRDDYNHFMLQEIHEQPKIMQNIISHRTHVGLILGTPQLYWDDDELLTGEFMRELSHIFITACGTSWHAGLVAKRWFENLVGIRTEVDIASEFRYRNPILSGDTLCLTISQSGETADALEGLRKAKAAFMRTLSLVNVRESTIARESDHVIDLMAGPEIGVASTKAYVAQLMSLMMLAIHMAKQQNKPLPWGEYIEPLIDLPNKANAVLEMENDIAQLAREFARFEGFVFIGRGYNVPTALEGALKLKEIAYVHAAGYPAGEFKHGPIALIDERVPTVAVMPFDRSFDRMMNNVMEIKARKGPVIMITSMDAPEVPGDIDHVIRIPVTHEMVSPILSIMPLQLLAYHIALVRGCSPDKPRNLAKSVTVE